MVGASGSVRLRLCIGAGLAVLIMGLVAGCGAWAQRSKAGPIELVFRTVAINRPARLRVLIDRDVLILRRRLKSASPGAVVRRAGDRILVRVADAGSVPAALAVVVPGRVEFYDWEGNVLARKGRTAAHGLATQDPDALQLSQGSASAAPGDPGAGGLSIYAAVKLASMQPKLNGSGTSRHGPAYYLFGAPGGTGCAIAAHDRGQPPVAAVHCLLSGPATTTRELLSDLPPSVSASQGQLLTVPQGTTVLEAVPSTFVDPLNDAAPTARFYVLRDRPLLSGTQITDPRQSIDPTGSSQVTFDFTAHSRKVFARATATLAHRGERVSQRGQRLYQHFAVALDDQLVAVLAIDFSLYPNGVRGEDSVEIDGRFTTRSARDLATLVRFGPLPVALTRLR